MVARAAAVTRPPVAARRYQTAHLRLGRHGRGRQPDRRPDAVGRHAEDERPDPPYPPGAWRIAGARAPADIEAAVRRPFAPSRLAGGHQGDPGSTGHRHQGRRAATGLGRAAGRGGRYPGFSAAPKATERGTAGNLAWTRSDRLVPSGTTHAEIHREVQRPLAAHRRRPVDAGPATGDSAINGDAAHPDSRQAHTRAPNREGADRARDHDRRGAGGGPRHNADHCQRAVRCRPDVPGSLPHLERVLGRDRYAHGSGYRGESRARRRDCRHRCGGISRARVRRDYRGSAAARHPQWLDSADGIADRGRDQ